MKQLLQDLIEERHTVLLYRGTNDPRYIELTQQINQLRHLI